MMPGVVHPYDFKKECLVEALKRIADDTKYNLNTHDALILHRLSSAINSANEATR